MRSDTGLVQELLHRGLGYAFFIVALVAIFTGWGYLHDFGSVTSEDWRNAYIGVLAGLVALWCIVKLAGCMHGRHKRRTAGNAAPAKGGSSHSSSGADQSFANPYNAASEARGRPAGRA